MKKLLIFVILSLVIFSCKNGNDKITEDAKQIIPEELFQVKVEGITKYIDINGKVVFDFNDAPEGMELYGPSEGLIGYDFGEKMGYVDYDYNIVMEPQFDLAGFFDDGMALIRIKINGKLKYGFINKKGERIIEPQFDNATIFYEGLARIEMNGKIGYIDKQGEIIIEPQFDPHLHIEFADFKEGFALVIKDGKYTYIDQKGGILLQLDVDYAVAFSDGMAYFNIGLNSGFIDKEGQVVIKPIYAWAGKFSNGFVPVYYGDNYGPMDPGHNDMYYIDKTGEKAFGKEFYHCGDFSEGFAQVGIVNDNGEIEIFIINTSGNIVFKLPENISYMTPFRNGIARLKMDSEIGDDGKQIEPIKIGYINTEGVVIWEPTN